MVLVPGPLSPDKRREGRFETGVFGPVVGPSGGSRVPGGWGPFVPVVSPRKEGVSRGYCIRRDPPSRNDGRSLQVSSHVGDGDESSPESQIVYDSGESDPRLAPGPESRSVPSESGKRPRGPGTRY